MHRELGRPSLVESFLPDGLGSNHQLERINDVVDWGRFSKLVEGVYSASEGRPSYPPLTMVKVLLLEQWYNLSDPQMEETLGDRISFRHFVGLGLQDDTPDHSTISRFRGILTEKRLVERLMKELSRQLEERGDGGKEWDTNGCDAGGVPGQAGGQEGGGYGQGCGMDT